MKNKGSKGIIIGIIISGVVTIALNLYLLPYLYAAVLWTLALGRIRPPSLFFYLVINIIVSLLQLIVVVNIFRLKEWARSFIVILNMIDFVFIVCTPTSNIFFDILLWFWFLSLIYFFTRPKVKEQFR